VAVEESKPQVEGEIREAQAQLGESLEALGEKVAPKQVVGKAKATAHDKLDEVADKVSPPRVARRQVEKVKDKLGRESDEGEPSQEDDDVRARLARAAREIEATEGGGD
jgi:hypothetical protein